MSKVELMFTFDLPGTKEKKDFKGSRRTYMSKQMRI